MSIGPIGSKRSSGIFLPYWKLMAAGTWKMWGEPPLVPFWGLRFSEVFSVCNLVGLVGIFHTSQLVDAWGLFWTAIFWKHGERISTFKTSKELHIFGYIRTSSWDQLWKVYLCWMDDVPNKTNMPAVGSSFVRLKNQLHLVSVNLFTSIRTCNCKKTPIQYNIPIQSIAAQTTNPKT